MVQRLRSAGALLWAVLRRCAVYWPLLIVAALSLLAAAALAPPMAEQYRERVSAAGGVSGSNAEVAPPPAGTFAVRRLLMPFDIAKICLADAQQFDPLDAQFLRYIYLPYHVNQTGYTQAVNFSVNLALSQSSVIQYGWLIHPQVIRYDLRLLAPVVGDLQNLIDTFEELAFDPYFHEFVEIVDDIDTARDATLDALKVLLGLLDQETVDAKAKVSDGLQLAKLQQELSRGRTFDLAFLEKLAAGSLTIGGVIKDKNYNDVAKAIVSLRKAAGVLAKLAGDVAKIEVKSRRSGAGALGINEEVPIPARHAGEAFELLAELVQSDACIVRADYFLVRALASIDLGHGAGLYYQFLGVRAGQNGLTDFEQLLADLGVNEELLARQGVFSKSAIAWSGVTGRTRAVIGIPSVSVAPGRSTGFVTYTQDPSNDQVAAANEPLRNLLAFTFAAQELIWERRNGMLAFDLFNAAGLRQAKAPDNVVCDSRVPDPYTRELYSCMSCLRCHGPAGGRMAVGNDVLKLTRGNADILDDLASADGLDALLDKLAGEYSGDLSKPLQRSRDDFGEATFRATSGMRLGNDLANNMVTFKAMSVPEVCAFLSAIHVEYTYRPVSPAMVLADLGYLVTDEGHATELLNQVAPNGVGVTLLDPTLALLNVGVSVTRPAVELIYFDLALRSIITAKSIAQGEVNALKEGTPLGQMFSKKGSPVWDRVMSRRSERTKRVIQVPGGSVRPAAAKPRSSHVPAQKPTSAPRKRAERAEKTKGLAP